MNRSKIIEVEPVLSYPRRIAPGGSGALSVDLRHSLDPEEWPYDGEEYPLTCIVDTEGRFACEAMGDTSIVLHRFGGSYGPAAFLLTASAGETARSEVRITLVNRAGRAVQVLEFDDIEVNAEVVRLSVSQGEAGTRPQATVKIRFSEELFGESAQIIDSQGTKRAGRVADSRLWRVQLTQGEYSIEFADLGVRQEFSLAGGVHAMTVRRPETLKRLSGEDSAPETTRGEAASRVDGPPPITTQALVEDGVLEELASVFDTEMSAASLLEHTGVPRERIRPFGQSTLVEYWESVCRELEKGLTPDGPAALLEAAAERYPHNETFQRALRRGDEEDRGPLAQKLEELYDRREELTLAGDDTRAVDREIRDVRRLLRKGPQLQPGEFLLDGRFKLVEVLGKGGFGTVWKAYDRKLKRLVALKLLHGQHSEDRSKRERFFRGARKMAELAHPNVVGVLERELEDDGWLFFVMELVTGGDFSQAVLAGRLSLDEKLAIVGQVGDALEFAHGRGIVHRDVKPSNVLLDEDLRAKLTDFDLVRAEDSTGFTATRAMMGTLNFAAPEALAAARGIGPAADVYSLGSIAVFALRGKALPPDYYRDPRPAIAELDVTVELKDVLERAVALEARERFASVREFCEALDRAARQQPFAAGGFKDE